MSFLNIIGVRQHETVAGISVTDSLCTFVALRKWGADDLHVVDVKFYTAEDGSGLSTCPYKKEFQKHMVPYDGDFNFNLALRDFIGANRVERLAYSAEDVAINASNVTLVPVADTELAGALAVLRTTSPLKDRKEATGILAHFINAVPKNGDLSKAQDRIEPVCALLYAIVASGLVAERAQRASAQEAAEQAAEQAALEREAHDPFYRDERVVQRSKKDRFDLILTSNGVRIQSTKHQTLTAIRHRGARLAPEELAV